MSRHLDISALQPLRRQRRLLGWLTAALLAVSLAGALGQCLVEGSTSLFAAVAAKAPAGSAMPDDMPCEHCTAGDDSQSLDEAAVTPTGSLKPGFALALIMVSTLLALSFPKSIPIPPRPFLPKRPRTLEFAVLRI